MYQRIFNHQQYKTILLFIVVLFSLQSYGQLKDDWAKVYGSPGASTVPNDVAVDHLGNIFVGGYFTNTADMDAGVAVANITSNGLNDAYLAKYDSIGNYLWSLSFGGGDYDAIESIDVDLNGDVFVTGYFLDTMDVDPGPGVVNHIGSALTNYRDVFIVKYSANGTYLWSHSFGNNFRYDQSHDLIIDSFGSAYVVGEFGSSIDIEPGAGTTLLTSNGSSDLFLIKYSSTGSLIWGKNLGGSSTEYGRAMSFDKYGNIQLAGTSSSATMDADAGPGTAILTKIGTGYSNMFVAKYDAAGNYLNAFNIGGMGTTAPTAIGYDTSNNILITGSLNDTVDFDPGVGVQNRMSHPPYRDFFVAKYDELGNFIWTNNIGGNSYCDATNIQTDENNNIYLTGRFDADSLDFDTGAGTYIIDPTNYADGFLAKYDSTFAIDYAFSIKSGSYENVNGLAVFGEDDFLLAMS